MIIAIDPGNEVSAIICWKDKKIVQKEILENHEILDYLNNCDTEEYQSDVLAVEMIACYGMPVGKTVFETCVWIGRFIQTWRWKFELIYRKDIKLHFCQSVRAKDSNIRQALIDRFGEPGTKPHPGKLYGIKKDLWAALALCVYYHDNFGKGK